MPRIGAPITPDRGQRRASLAQSRSKETKRMLVQAAMALWRTNGYATTTVADICRAAGVSKALFYFYFPRKEDVLFEVGVMSTKAAQRTIAGLLGTDSDDYDMAEVISAALHSMENSMNQNPRELIVETILEGYRHEHRILNDGTPPDLGGGMFTELFARARTDGKLPEATNVNHLAYLAMTLVSEGARHWAAGAFGHRSFAEVVGADICTLIAGIQQTEN
ncbi:AcrR family transcriptional regulator [Mycobacterium sp. MAA66]|uniref:TetR/AcrR family transcriptional regulator n=1 Tax=Mycobacterium sp. MAA66 TaxID=3156297 RepID=UPI003510F8F4